MPSAGKVVRTLGHPVVATLASREYAKITEREDLTAAEQVGAVLGTAALQLLGHVLVEAAANWVDSD